MRITVIIPCYNEGDAIKKTYEKLVSVLQKDSSSKDYAYELIFIDDGSKDNTLDVIKGFEEKDKCVRYVSFSRNFGKEAGMLAGLSYSSGDAVILIDADLQHPPELIPDMVRYYLEGYDQVIAKRNRAGDSKTKTLLSKLYYGITNNLIDVKLSDGIGDFRLLSRKAVDALLSMKEYIRFSKGLFSWIGFREKIIEYENQSRVEGESKWSFKKLLQYGIDGILSFNDRPLRSIIYLGFIMIMLGILYFLYSLICIIINHPGLPGYFTIMAFITFIGGIQLICAGVIGEYIGRIYYEVKRRPHFLVNDTNIEKAKSYSEYKYRNE